MRRAECVLSVALALALLPALAAGQEERVDIAEIDLDALLDLSVEAVALHEERASAASASVFVLTAEDLRRHGFATLEEALRAVPGLFGYADGLYPMVGVRGIGLPGDYTTRLLVLVDGHPLNNSLAIGESYLGRDLPVPLAAVTRIEVVKGPVGSVYGPTAFLGVVNLVTTGTARRLEVSASGDAGQGALRAGDASFAGSGEKAGVTWTASAAAFATRGLDHTYPELLDGRDGRVPPPGGRVTGMDFADSLQSYARASWRDLTAGFSCGRWHGGVPSAAYLSIIGDDRNAIENRTCFAQLSLSRAVAPSLTLMARASYDDFFYGDNFAYPTDGYGLFVDEGRDRWGSLELRGLWRAGATHAVFGAEGQAHDTVQHSFARGRPSLLEDPVNGVGLGVIEKSFRSLNAYALVEHTLARTVTLHGGITFYVHQMFGDRLTPKVAAVWRPSARDVLKAVYSEGFRAPTMSEAFFEDGATYLANPRLKPETVRSLEVLYERRFGPLSLSGSLFQNDYRDLIVFQSVLPPGAPDPSVARPEDYRQVGVNALAMRTRGAEVILRASSLHVQGWAGVSAQSLDGSRRANFPELTATFALSTRSLWRPLTLSLDGAFVAARATDPTVASSRPPAVPPALTLNAFASLEVPGAAGLTVEVAVRNALDRDVQDPVPGDFAPISRMSEAPRTVRAGVRYRF